MIILYIALGLGAFLGVIVLILKNPALRPAPAPMQEIRTSPAAIEKDVRYLAEDCYPRAFHRPELLQKAADYIKNRFEEMGYEVEEQHYVARDSPQRNLIARVGPAEGARLIIGAHYDVCGEQPGADDNASAVAGLLAIAQLLKESAHTLTVPVELVAYTLEEQPFFRSNLMGSYIHAESLKKAGIPVKGMICLEMIGYFDDLPRSQRYPIGALRALYPSRGNFIAVIGSLGQASFTRRIKQYMSSGASGLPVVSINAPKNMRGIDLSDHRNYWKMGYNAVMITNTAFFRNPNYHQPSDTPETLDFERMAKVVQGVYWAIYSFSSKKP